MHFFANIFSPEKSKSRSVIRENRQNLLLNEKSVRKILVKLTPGVSQALSFFGRQNLYYGNI